jgi:hypothetical protein
MTHYPLLQHSNDEKEASARNRELKERPNPCSQCAELLCDYGNALIRFHAIIETQRQYNGLGFAYTKDYLDVQRECACLRARLKIHLRGHDHDVSEVHR